MNRSVFFDAVRASLFGGKLNAQQVACMEAVLDAFETYGDGDLDKEAYCLATSKHESGDYRYTHEIWGPTAAQKKYEGRADLGNTVAGDGYKFRGRGFMCQLTGRRNYTDWSKRLGIDLIADPDKAAEIGLAARIGVQGSMLGTFTGKKLANYIGGGQPTDFVNARRVINGTDKADLIAGYAKQFAAAIRKAGSASPPAGDVPAVNYDLWKRGVAYDELKEVQGLLQGAGYYLQGEVDGKWGVLTRDSLLAFKAGKNLARTDVIDDATMAALRTAKPRELPPERSQATVQDVAPKSEIIPAAQAASWWSKILGFFGFVGTVGSGAVSAIPDAQGKVAPIQQLAPSIPGWVWLAAVAVIALCIAFAAYKATHKANKVTDLKVDEYRAGGQA